MNYESPNNTKSQETLVSIPLKQQDSIIDRLDRIERLLRQVYGNKTYSIQDVATLLGKHHTTIRKHVTMDNPLLNSVRRNGQYIITQEHLDEYLTQ